MQKTENDMEELFREAAENYPLKISGANWNKVLAALDSKENYPAKRPNKKKWWWSSLLLLLIPFICTKMQQRSEGKTITSLASVVNTTANTRSLLPVDITYSSNSNSLPNGNNLLLPVSLLNNNTRKDINDNAVAQKQNDASLRAYHLLQWKQAAKANISIAASPAEEDVDLSLDNAFASNTISQPKNILAKERAKETIVISTDNKEENKPIENKQQDKNKKQHSSSAKFYISLLGGASSSKVKGEGYQQFRITAGVSVGYTINKRIAVEAGAFYSQKKYNTAFEYFDNSKTQWPSIRIIKKVEGECTMIELPVSVRYNFKPVRKHSYFASAGLSSYIMKKEDYDYNYTLPGNSMQHSMYKSYYNSGKNWFSVLQLSAGWQHSIGKKTAVRVQPYYNMPLSGVGLGKLPISGLGAVAGVTIGLK